MTSAYLLSLVLFLQAPAEPSEKGWIYWLVSPEKMSAGQVAVFSVCLDDQPCQHVKPQDSAVPEFPNWYRWKLPALLVGSHTATVQLCNPVECGAAVAEPFVLKVQIGTVDRVVVR